MCVPLQTVSVSQCSGTPSLYEVLGVSLKATTEEIRLSYLKLARLWHPDRHGGSESAKRKFQQIQCAYEVLSNERRRAHYDLQWLAKLDVEDYLNRFKDLILTANGLCLSLGDLANCSEQGSGQLADCERGSTASVRRASIRAA
ncbi:hypothetical protein Agub_g10190 [Astrephomene gubernaculifera]|uniref:J domain-containing protein n=1 Tax=Astrephomene gubernaculifera TaxID=47775 RepID=A0AAD3DWF8_9CHLO|nr:hypothetical protein Agub_g10190 [Astrephomene gubernaculifera]